MERKHRALLLALPTVLTLLFFFVAPMVYILVHTLHENGFSDTLRLPPGNRRELFPRPAAPHRRDVTFGHQFLTSTRPFSS